MARQFTAQGHTIVDDPALADQIIVNTCAVTHDAVRGSRKLVRRHALVVRAQLDVEEFFHSSFDRFGQPSRHNNTQMLGGHSHPPRDFPSHALDGKVTRNGTGHKGRLQDPATKRAPVERN